MGRTPTNGITVRTLKPGKVKTLPPFQSIQSCPSGSKDLGRDSIVTDTTVILTALKSWLLPRTNRCSDVIGCFCSTLPLGTPAKPAVVQCTCALSEVPDSAPSQRISNHAKRRRAASSRHGIFLPSSLFPLAKGTHHFLLNIYTTVHPKLRVLVDAIAAW